MTFVDCNVAIAVFVVIIAIAMLAAIIIDPEAFDKTRWRTFLVTAASLSIVITFMWYFNLLEQGIKTDVNTDNNEKRHIEQKVIEASINDIRQNMDKIPEFCTSLLPLQDIPPNRTLKKTPISRDKKIIYEATLSYKLFDTWDHFTYSSIHPEGDVCYFLQWASSKQLKKQWDRQYVNFSKKTQKFGDKLFSIAGDIDEHTPENYLSAAKLFV